MRLHTNPELFKDAIHATAQYLNLPEIYIEKDYWVTLALREIFLSEHGAYAVFKGGTSLSKCYRLIERFSEDIDIAVVCTSGESDNAIKQKLRGIGKAVEQAIPEMDSPYTNKMGRIRKTVHQYAHQQQGEFGQVREQIMLEVTSLGSAEPYDESFVQSYFTEMMASRGLEHMIHEHGLESFKIQVLSKERTFCEKIMSLVRWSYGQNPFTDLRNKIRHTYDLHLMLQHPKVQGFFQSDAFPALLGKVAQHDQSLSGSQAWLAPHPADALIFQESTWQELSSTYTGDFKKLVHGQLPDETLVRKSLAGIAQRLAEIDWQRNP